MLEFLDAAKADYEGQLCIAEIAGHLLDRTVHAIREGLTSQHTGPFYDRIRSTRASLRSSVRALLLVGSDPDVPVSPGAVAHFDQSLHGRCPARNRDSARRQ